MKLNVLKWQANPEEHFAMSPEEQTGYYSGYP